MDDTTGRVIIVAAEADPRLAALVQVDVQSSMPDAKVLIARPIAIDISAMARTLLEPFNITEVDFDRARKFLNDLKDKDEKTTQDLLAPLADGAAGNIPAIFEKVELPAIGQIVSVISQAAMLPWRDILDLFNETAVSGNIDLRALLARDSLAADLAVGICPIPLYQFSEQDFDLFLEGRRIEDCRERLKSLGLYQYFFPAPDQLALALVEKGIGDHNAILRDAGLAPQMGHPFGDAEILDGATKFEELVEKLRDSKLIVEGEYGFEISQEGRSVRGNIKFSPREGLVSKIINRISVSLSPADFLK